jgi:hypothetical protein
MTTKKSISNNYSHCRWRRQGWPGWTICPTLECADYNSSSPDYGGISTTHHHCHTHITTIHHIPTTPSQSQLSSPMLPNQYPSNHQSPPSNSIFVMNLSALSFLIRHNICARTELLYIFCVILSTGFANCSMATVYYLPFDVAIEKY